MALPEFSLLNIISYTESKNNKKKQQKKFHFISDDHRHDTSLFPVSFKQCCQSLINANRGFSCFMCITDSSKKDVKAVIVFKRHWDTCDELKIDIIFSNFPLGMVNFCTTQWGRTGAFFFSVVVFLPF